MTMRLFLPELAILNLTRKVSRDDPEYMPDEEAWQVLREEGSVDFGDDLAKWAAWVDQEFTSKRRSAIDAKEK